MSIQTTTIKVGNHTLTLEMGRYAQRATAAATAQIGETLVFASVVMGRANPGLGYFPLQVEYQEKLFAGGKIKGSRWVKRDGRPSDEAILKGRIIDRTIRPLFPNGLVNEIQIVTKVLSVDGQHDADMIAMYAVSAALAASPIPWQGPVSAVRIGLTADDEFVINPTFEQRESSKLDLILSGTQEATIMLEAGANEVSEAKMLQAFSLAQEHNATIAKDITAWVKGFAQPKIEFEAKKPSQTLLDTIATEIGQTQLEVLTKATALLEPVDLNQLADNLAPKLDPETLTSDIKDALNYLIKQTARRMTVEQSIRPDGRKFDEIRPLSSSVGVLPRTHGSAVFQRGSTQALTVVTLGSPSLNQLIENMEGEYSKRYIHHYEMPPYTVGEAGRIGWPSRREVGHGALAERALEPMIPSEETFPYTIHVVSEMMSSNGSTSMASVCGSTLALMDAGVPLIKPVAGMAMGLIAHDDEHVVLTDIMGFEDHVGDMDFKVAGTADGITAMQMDIKVSGIPYEVLEQALEQARVGRLAILEHMLSTLPEARSELSAYAPKIVSISIPVDRIGEIIGPSGKIIKKIIADTGADVDINDDGTVFISSQDSSAIQQAKDYIEGILKQVEAGEEYDGTVVKLSDFGAFVEILPGKSGLVHVSRMSTEYVKDPATLVSVGDTVHVRVLEIDNLGRINLSMLSELEETQARSNRGGSEGPKQDDRGNFNRSRRPSGGSRFQSRPPRSHR